MTTGNISDDKRVQISTQAGPGKVGSLYFKQWSGTDYPKQRGTYVQTYDGRGGVHRKYVRPPKRARVVEHPYTMSLVSSIDNLMAYSDNGRTYYSCTFENTFGPPSNTVSITANDEIAVLGKLRQAIVGSDFNPAVFMAEGKQALEMIFTAATRVSKAWTAANKGNFAAAANALSGGVKAGGKRRKTASNWLELQYGWLPLLKDAYSGAEFLAHLSSAPFQTTVTVSKTKRGNATASHLRFLGNDCFATMKIKAILKEVDIIGLSGLKDPAEVIWEKIPYSFVLDWFVPIQNYLAARALKQSLKGTFVVTKYSHIRVRGRNAKSIYSYFTIRDSAYAYTAVNLTRTVDTTLSVPMPEVKALGDVPSWRRAANAVALVTQKAVKR